MKICDCRQAFLIVEAAIAAAIAAVTASVTAACGKNMPCLFFYAHAFCPCIVPMQFVLRGSSLCV